MVDQLLSHVPLSLHVFMALATITILGAGGVAFSSNIVYSAFSLLASFAGVVGLFGFLSNDFLAVVQLMVYVGGILVLILFAVMLTNKIQDVSHSNPSSNLAAGLPLLGALLTIVLAAVLQYDWPVKADPGPYEPTAQIIGAAFLGEYLLAFEIAGLMLLAALIAAVVVARKEVKEVEVKEEGAAQ